MIAPPSRPTPEQLGARRQVQERKQAAQELDAWRYIEDRAYRARSDEQGGSSAKRRRWARYFGRQREYTRPMYPGGFRKRLRVKPVAYIPKPARPTEPEA